MFITIRIVSNKPANRELNGTYEYPHLEDAIEYLAARTGLDMYEVQHSKTEGWVIIVHDEGMYREKHDIQRKKQEGYSQTR